MLKNILMVVSTLLLFSACTPKVEYVYLQGDKHKFTIPGEIKPITVNERFHYYYKDNELKKIEKKTVAIETEKYISYIMVLRAKIDNLVSQINDYEKDN